MREFRFKDQGEDSREDGVEGRDSRLLALVPLRGYWEILQRHRVLWL